VQPANTDINPKEHPMNNSILGSDLEASRERIFITKIGFVISQKNKIKSREDLRFVTDVEVEITQKQGRFEPTYDQFQRLTIMHNNLNPVPINPEMIDKLIPEAKTIIRNGRLQSGRMRILVKIVEKYDSDVKLTRDDENMLHFLVLEGTDYHESED
jgi:hypothetical protein